MFKNNFIAAPMAGFTDLAWRIVAIELGAGLVFSEMVSVEGLKRAQEKTLHYVINNERARPFGIQLYGSTAEAFTDAVNILQSRDIKFDSLDINMGCPVKKVASNGAGAALMKTPGTAGAIIKSVRHAYQGPISVKIRSGWDENNINATLMAKIAEDCGANAVIVHPRTKAQGFKGKADWDIVRQVKESVKIKVIGNGDIVDRESAQAMFNKTGCDAVMVGRAALGNPWIFSPVLQFPPPLVGGGQEEGETLREKIALIRRHMSLLREFEDERYTINMMKKFIPRYLKGLRGCKELSAKIYAAKSVRSVMDGLEFFEHLHDNGQ